jgi:hypothetical protein
VLSYTIGIYDNARAQARQINFFERWLTSAGRRIAAAGIFDRVLELANLNDPNKHNSPFSS